MIVDDDGDGGDTAPVNLLCVLHSPAMVWLLLQSPCYGCRDAVLERDIFYSGHPATKANSSKPGKLGRRLGPAAEKVCQALPG